VLTVGLNRAVDVLAKKLASVRLLGNHPKDQMPVTVRKGRFGPYIQHGMIVANVPREQTMDDISLEEAVVVLTEKGKKLLPKGAKGRKPVAKGKAKAAPVIEAAAPAAARKSLTKKAPAKKPAAKKKPAVKEKIAAVQPRDEAAD
jgi:DNA topoisomerase-1